MIKSFLLMEPFYLLRTIDGKVQFNVNSLKFKKFECQYISQQIFVMIDSGNFFQFYRIYNVIINSLPLLRVDSFEELSSYAEIFSNRDLDKIVSYDELQEMSTNIDDSSFTKEYFDMNYDFDTVLIEGEEGLAIFDISSWRDWDSDDKIQLAISGGPVILKDMSEVKLLNSENADEDSIYNYALSLAGSEDRIFNHSLKS